MQCILGVRDALKPYLIILIAPFVLLAPILLRGQALFWGTPSLQFVPWWWQAWLSLRQGVLPLWNPNNGLGAPLLANYQVALLYPPNWMLYGMAAAGGPPAVAWGYTFLAAAHLAWAGLGMAILLRKLGIGWHGQMVGGLTFGLSGYLVARLGFFSMVWAGSWLPWVIYFSCRLASFSSQIPSELRGRWLPSIGLVGCLSMQLLSGHAQLTWYSWLLAGMWVIAAGLRSGGLRPMARALAGLVLAVVWAAGIAAVQLVPTFEYLQLSPRAESFAFEDALTYSFWPWRFLTLFAPDFFGSPGMGNYWGYASYWEDHLYLSLTPMLLALATLFLLARGVRVASRDRHWSLVLFAWVLLLIAFVLGLGKFTPIFPFLYRWAPTFDMFQAPARFLIWAAFALPILAAVGSEHWNCPAGRGLYWFRLGTAGTFAVTLGAGLAWLLMEDIQLTFVRATALAGIWGLGFGLLTLVIPYVRKHQRTTLWQWGVLAWILVDLLAVGWGLNPGVGLDFYSSPDPGVAMLNESAQGQRIYMSRSEEYDLKFRRFLRFADFRSLEDWQAMRHSIIPNLNLLDEIPSANNFDPLVTERYARWIGEIETLSLPARHGWLALMNVGFEERIDGSATGGVRFDRVDGAQRFHWYSCAQVVTGQQEAWALLQLEFSAPPNRDRKVILEIPGQSLNACQPTAQTVIRMVVDHPQRVVVEVNAQAGGWLVFADSWYPGWIAKIDGRAVSIYPADTLFKAVYVEAGAHNVEYIYRPKGFYFSALFSILVLLSTIVLYRYRGRGIHVPLSFS